MILEVKDGNFSYGKVRRGQEPAYLYKTPIHLQVNPGEILAILGPNGAGKTTLLKCIMGLLKWKNGETYLDGKPISTLASKNIWKSIGYVPQASKMPFAYTILDLVLMGRALFIRSHAQPSEKDKEEAIEALELVGIAHLAEKSCNMVSGGELQLALIARTLVSHPKILIMDEPESHLDIQKQQVILQTIKKLVREKNISCIINTHYANHAFYFGDKVLMVAKNKPVISGSVQELMNEANMKDYFNIDIKKITHQDDDKTYQMMVPTYFGESVS